MATTETPRLDQIKELHRQLGVLLDDPQPGLMSWLSAYDRVMRDIVAFWNEKEDILQNMDRPSCVVTWTAEDIKMVQDDLNEECLLIRDLTDDEIDQILMILAKDHDCSIGINWDIIRLCVTRYASDHGIWK